MEISIDNDTSYTCDQLGEKLGVRPSTLRRWRQQGTGPDFYRPFHTVILYRAADVERWLQERDAA